MSRMRPAEIDDLIDGRYAVERLLGQGDVGLVYSGRHCALGQQVAIKFLQPELAQHFETAEAFRRQARSTAAIDADHVCSVLDVSTLDTGVPYIVMEYLEGRDLQRELEEQPGERPYEDAVDYILQACDGLASLLVAGIVHRDLRPSKLFVAERRSGRRTIKLLDPGSSGLVRFAQSHRSGLLRVSNSHESGFTRCIQYLAPEQLDAPERVDPRCNVWALGALLYHLLNGNPPYLVETTQQLAALQRRAATPCLKQLEATLPEGLTLVLERALARERSARFASVSELAQGLAPFAPERSLPSLERISRLMPPRVTSWGRHSGALSGHASTESSQPRLPVTTSGVAPVRSLATTSPGFPGSQATRESRTVPPQSDVKSAHTWPAVLALLGALAALSSLLLVDRGATPPSAASAASLSLLQATPARTEAMPVPQERRPEDVPAISADPEATARQAPSQPPPAPTEPRPTTRAVHPPQQPKQTAPRYPPRSATPIPVTDFGGRR